MKKNPAKAFRLIKVTMAALLLSLAVLLLPAMGGFSVPGSIKAQAASISTTKLTMLKGQSAQLKLYDVSGDVTWKSSKINVATVSDDGVVTAKKRGSCTITAKAKGKKFKCKIRVSLIAGPVDVSNAVRGIDVSAWQGIIDFNAVKKSGVEFVIIRIGHGTKVDRYFEKNYKKAKKAGLKVGGYWYSTAMSKSQAVSQRKRCLSKIRGKSFDFPIFIDIEHLPQLKAGPTLTGVVIKDFCAAMKKAGFRAGFYTSRGFIGRFVSPSVARNYGYFQWIAEYSTKNRYGHSYNMWQYGAGRVAGVKTLCDLDYYFPNEENGVG